MKFPTAIPLINRVALAALIHIVPPGTSTAFAEDETRNRRVLEEVIVVAQKRAQSAQDVPISISVISEDFIEEWSITDLNSAVLYTPNVRITDAGYFIIPRVRGFGVDQNNKAFEPPAGVAIDGIPYTRLEYFLSAMFDIERMEVYRGPQGTGFGKNTTAGLIHLITRSPTPDYEGFVDVQAGNYGRRRIEAGLGGPLLENRINFRLAVLDDERDGFVDNSATVSLSGAPDEMRSTSRQAWRAKLEFVDLGGSNLKLTAESVDIHSIGAGQEMFNISDTMRETLLRYDPATDFERSNDVSTINDPDFRKVQLETYNVEWRKALGEWDLVTLGGYSRLSGSAAVDADFTPADALAGADSDVSPTETAELRIESPLLDGFLGLESLFGQNLGSSTFLTGFYYQGREIRGDGLVWDIGASYADLFIASFDNENSQVPEALLQALELAGVVTQPNIGGSGYQEQATMLFNQRAAARAVFGQLHWNVGGAWSVDAGLRYNDEWKRASFDQDYTSDGSALMQILGVEEYEASLKKKESQFTHRLSLNYEPFDELSIFLHWARGFRGGGFNAFSFRDNPDELQYDSEVADDYGLDIKSVLLDGRMRLNVSLFQLVADDFQVLTGVANERGFGVGGTKVENAAKARSQGVEADLTWLLHDTFTLFATFGYNDTEYLEFTNNNCLSDNTNTDGDEDPRCDVTGKPFALTPRYSGTLLGMFTLPLNRHGLLLQLGGGLDYQSSQYTNSSLDDRYQQGEMTRWRATAGISHVRQGWSLRIQGENLTDERAVVRQSMVIRGVITESLEPPRTVYATFRYAF